MRSERKVFSLRGHQAGSPMTLRESEHRVDALDSTGALIATARFVSPSAGWGIVQCMPAPRILGYEPLKDDAIRKLRHIVGEMK
jgi:hypothetical protein